MKWPKCWGENVEVFQTDYVSVNLLHLLEGGVCSWHHHQHKANLFYLISGKVRIKTEDGVTMLSPGESVYVPPLIKHQFEALESSEMIEVMYVSYDRDDIIRERKGFLRKDEEVSDNIC